LLCFWTESADSWFFLSFSRYVDSAIRGSGRAKTLAGSMLRPDSDPFNDVESG
jgi:hypothetical protein